MNIPLAEVISRRQLLSPREAATLTLAVGREWDRQRARHAAFRLPDVARIVLTDAGEISFVDAPHPQHRAATSCGDLTLSALLGQLLGLDEQEAPGQHIPGGLLITIAGRLGPIELPSSREDGFRSALLRFADDDPGVLVRVFDRIIGARDAVDGESVVSRSTKVRRAADRRRQPAAVTALRRAVRELERQTFEARVLASRAAVAQAPRQERFGRGQTTALAAACAALIVAGAGFLLGNGAPPRPVSTPQVVERGTETPFVAPVPAPVAAPVASSRKPRSVRAQAVAVSRPRAESRKTPVNPPHATFAGGSRAITWTRTSR